MITRKILVLLCTLMTVASCAREMQKSVCSGNSGLAITRAYAIAISYPDNLPQFVAQNRALFSANGDAIKCGRVLISQLRAAALSGPSPESVREEAMSVATRSGRSDLGPALADDMLQNRTDMLLLASYLESLVETLPDMAQGNLGPYRNTPIYTTMKFIWTSSEGLLLPEDLKAIRNMGMQLNEWYLGNLIAALA